jgi:hypothetical protein
MVVMVEQTPVTPIRYRGRKRGSGCNFFLLKQLGTDKPVWGVPRSKMLSIKKTANKAGIGIIVRKISDNGRYAIWRKS